MSVEELADLLADVGRPPEPPNERLEYVLRYPQRVDLVTVAYLRECVQRLDERYDHTPSTLLLADAGQLHGQVLFLRQHANSGVQHALAATVGESATLMGQLVWDASQRREHAASAAYFEQAINAAQETRDFVTEGNALLRQSFLARYGTRQPTKGLALTSKAAQVSCGDSDVIAGLAHLHRAEAHAILGQDRDCSRALSLAETHFSAADQNDPAKILSAPSQFAQLEGSCWLFLNRPDKALAACSPATIGPIGVADCPEVQPKSAEIHCSHSRKPCPGQHPPPGRRGRDLVSAPDHQCYRVESIRRWPQAGLHRCPGAASLARQTGCSRRQGPTSHPHDQLGDAA